MSEDDLPTDEDGWTAQDRMAMQTHVNNTFGAHNGFSNFQRWQMIHQTLELEDKEIDLLWTAEEWSTAFKVAYTELACPQRLLCYHWLADLRAEFFEEVYQGDDEKADFEYHTSSLWAQKLLELQEVLLDGKDRETVRHDWIQ